MPLATPTLFEPVSTIIPWSFESIGNKLVSGAGTALANTASAVFPVANTAILVPFYLRKPIMVAQLLWLNGATASGNVDVGIYDEAGARKVSTTSTAQGTISVLQVVNITDTALGPGLYYLAIAMDNITGTLSRGLAGSVARCALTGMAEMATAFPLPDPITFATVVSDYVPLVGLTTRTAV